MSQSQSTWKKSEISGYNPRYYTSAKRS